MGFVEVKEDASNLLHIGEMNVWCMEEMMKVLHRLITHTHTHTLIHTHTHTHTHRVTQSHSCTTKRTIKQNVHALNPSSVRWS